MRRLRLWINASPRCTRMSIWTNNWGRSRWQRNSLLPPAAGRVLRGHRWLSSFLLRTESRVGFFMDEVT